MDSATVKKLELLDWDLNFLDDDMDYLNQKETRTVTSSHRNLTSNDKMDCSSQGSTYSPFSTQISTQGILSQSSNIEYCTQESVHSISNMDISSQESSASEKMCISSQESSASEKMCISSQEIFQDTQIPARLENLDETADEKISSCSTLSDVYENFDMPASYKTEDYSQSVRGNAIVANAHYDEAKSSCHETLCHETKTSDEGIYSSTDTSDHDTKRHSMPVPKYNLFKKPRIVKVCTNISCSPQTGNLNEPILSIEKCVKVADYLKDSLYSSDLNDKAQEVSPLEVESSTVKNGIQEKFTSSKAMIFSSQSRESADMDEEIFKMNHSGGKDISHSVTDNIYRPVLAEKHCCCIKSFQIQKSILSNRKRYRAMVKRENVLKNREARIAEREAAVLRREELLRAREEKILNYESAVFDGK